MLYFLRNAKLIFQSDANTYFFFFIVADLKGGRWDLIIVLFYTSVMICGVEHLIL
jgi:hypothetical protein